MAYHLKLLRTGNPGIMIGGNEMKKTKTVILSLTLAMLLCACGGGTAPALGTDAHADTGTSGEAATPATKDNTAETKELHVTLPEDNGMFGIYKWVEMENIGVTVYLILWDDGIGTIDFVGDGTIRFVFYNNETMQVADEGAVPQKYAYADGKLTWTYTDESGEHTSTFIKLTAEERAAYEAPGVGSVTGTGEGTNKGNTSPWPDDNGGLAGVYKWVEMEEKGITANLIIYDGGVGVFDMLGVVESVKYDDTTMQTSGEGALPQNYTYEDGTLTWVCTNKDGEQISTFVKLNPTNS